MDPKACRRKFLQQLMASTGYLMTVAAGGRQAQAAAQGLKRRRHLINVVGPHGGWDTFYFHNAMHPKEVTGVSATDFFQRFQAADMLEHPTAPDRFLGPAMKQFTSADFSNLCIWRGIGKVGEHEISAITNQCGQFSNYAASYSSVISASLAQDYLRPLHYVQAAANPSSFGSQVGMMTGVAVPINVPDETMLQSLTSPSPFLPTQTRRDSIQAAISQLSQVALSGKFRLQSSQAIVRNFQTSVDGVNKLMGQAIAASPEFQAMKLRYENAVVSAFDNYVLPNSQLQSDCYYYNAGYYANYQTYGVGLSTIDVVGTPLRSFVSSWTFGFAMAEYLIKYDLSAVVDIPFPAGDFHDFNDTDFVYSMIGISLFREMLRSLAATPINPGTSDSLLSLTTMVMSSEFDRSPARSVQNPANSAEPGTNHGYANSVLLAGAGVAGGTVVGDVMTGPAGKYGGMASGWAIGQALPVNLSTGVPSASGTLVNAQSIFPTILQIFNATIPSVQITGAPVFTPVIRQS